MSMMRKNYNYLPTNSSPYFYSHFKILFQIIAIRYGENGADGEVFLDAVDAGTDLGEIARGGVSHRMGRSDKVERVL